MTTIALILVSIVCLIFIVMFIAVWVDNYRWNKVMKGEMTFRQYMGID